jgi:hypothetical protein
MQSGCIFWTQEGNYNFEGGAVIYERKLQRFVFYKDIGSSERQEKEKETGEYNGQGDYLVNRFNTGRYNGRDLNLKSEKYWNLEWDHLMLDLFEENYTLSF